MEYIEICMHEIEQKICNFIIAGNQGLLSSGLVAQH